MDVFRKQEQSKGIPLHADRFFSHQYLFCFRSVCNPLLGCLQVADEVDEEFLILPNGQVAAQQKPKPQIRHSTPPPVRRSRSLSPKRSPGLLGKLCNRFKSPNAGQLSQAAAISAYRDTYGIPPETLNDLYMLLTLMYCMASMLL